ncbi:hypothetical protein [Streptomyces sp. NPDC002588]|uniref:hypothetical protein n=1 Tax=Streptomyces sp. NPDC002588 TaxID=3154419 RepID=UPI003327D01A
MRHIGLGGELDADRIGMGPMPINALCTGANADDAERIRANHRALGLGVTHIDIRTGLVQPPLSRPGEAASAAAVNSPSLPRP